MLSLSHCLVLLIDYIRHFQDESLRNRHQCCTDLANNGAIVSGGAESIGNSIIIGIYFIAS